MSRNRRDFLTSCAGLMAGAVVPAAVAAAPLAVTDFRGKTLRLSAPAKRVVCLIESALSGLYMLGAAGVLVGVPANVYSGDVARHYAQLDARLSARQLPAPGNWDFVGLEAVLALQPDLVVVWSHQTESIAALERHGIAVYGVFIAGLADLRKEIRDLGILTGTSARAEILIAHADAELARIAAATATPEAARPSVYFAWGQGLLETSCRGSSVDELIDLAGGRNVCGDRLEHATVSLERVLGWNPDLIVLWHGARHSPASVLVDPQWRNLAAVRNRRVFQLPEVFECDLWTLKFEQALRMLAVWLHPGRMTNEDPRLARDRMMTTLYGKPLPA